jgi:hypothetical protein
MTDAFIAKVLSVIYNYEIDTEYSRVNEDFLLINKRDTKNTTIQEQHIFNLILVLFSSTN